MISNPIEVQLVGQSALLLLLPTIAIIISVFSIGLTLWLRHRDDARIEVRVGSSFTLQGAASEEYLVITATNKGRAGSTVLTYLEIKDRTGRGIVSVIPNILTDSLPKELGPGASAKVAMVMDGVIETVAQNHINLRGARAVATTGHGTYSVALKKQTVDRLSSR